MAGLKIKTRTRSKSTNPYSNRSIPEFLDHWASRHPCFSASDFQKAALKKLNVSENAPLKSLQDEASDPLGRISYRQGLYYWTAQNSDISLDAKKIALIQKVFEPFLLGQEKLGYSRENTSLLAQPCFGGSYLGHSEAKGATRFRSLSRLVRTAGVSGTYVTLISSDGACVRALISMGVPAAKIFAVNFDRKVIEEAKAALGTGGKAVTYIEGDLLTEISKRGLRFDALFLDFCFSLTRANVSYAVQTICYSANPKAVYEVTFSYGRDHESHSSYEDFERFNKWEWATELKGYLQDRYALLRDIDKAAIPEWGGTLINAVSALRDGIRTYLPKTEAQIKRAFQCQSLFAEEFSRNMAVGLHQRQMFYGGNQMPMTVMGGVFIGKSDDILTLWRESRPWYCVPMFSNIEAESNDPSIQWAVLDSYKLIAAQHGRTTKEIVDIIRKNQALVRLLNPADTN